MMAVMTAVRMKGRRRMVAASVVESAVVELESVLVDVESAVVEMPVQGYCENRFGVSMCLGFTA